MIWLRALPCQYHLQALLRGKWTCVGFFWARSQCIHCRAPATQRNWYQASPSPTPACWHVHPSHRSCQLGDQRVSVSHLK